MNKAKKMNPMQAWAVLSFDRFIKKSVIDGSLAVFDDEDSAESQKIEINDYPGNDCHTEEVLICNKNKLNEYAEVHDEMYEMLTHFVRLVEDDSSEDFLYHFHEIKSLLAKARGES